MNRYRLRVSAAILAAAVISACAQSQNVVACPLGQRLDTDGVNCVAITCIGGEIVGTNCVCPDEQLVDQGICRSPDDPCIGVRCNDENRCTNDVCAAAACSFEPAADGTRCLAAGAAGLCLDAACEEDPCARIDCDDRNDCTVDGVCNPESAECEGGRAATDGISCSFGAAPGVCESGGCVDAMLCAGKSCDDTDPCTEDVCDPMTGECSNQLVAELTPCEIEGVLGECIGQMCVGLCEDSATRCNDNDNCTVDDCDPETGCKNVAKSCNDGNSCTTDGCNTANGACINTTRSDGASCKLTCPINERFCIPLNGTCQGGVCKSIGIILPPFP